MDSRHTVLIAAFLCAGFTSASACDITQIADGFRQCWQSGTASVRTCETTTDFWGNKKYNCGLSALSRDDTIALLNKAVRSQNPARIKSAFQACQGGRSKQVAALVDDGSCTAPLMLRAIRHAVRCYQPQAGSPRRSEAECESP